MSTDSPTAPRRVVIRTERIDLGALLKLAHVCATGGEAKQLIRSGRVAVNGEVEHRRGRQVRPGDVVDAAGAMLTVERAR